MFIERDEERGRTKVCCDAAFCDEKLWIADSDFNDQRLRKDWAMETVPIGGKMTGFVYCPDHKRQETGV